MSSKTDYTLLAERLKKNAGKYRIDFPLEYDVEGQTLPIFPMTEIRGGSIVILWDENSEQVWDYDEEDTNLIEVAKGIELELRAIKYVKLKFMQNISEFEKDLKELGVSEENIPDIIYSAYSSLQKLFIDMDGLRPRIEDSK